MSDQTNTQENKQEPYRHPPSFQTIDGVISGEGVTKDLLGQIKNLPVKTGDVFVATYPKAGTTWVSEIVWQIFFDGAVVMRPIHERVPYLELQRLVHQIQGEEFNLREFYLKKAFPRVYKIHLPYHQAPMGDGLTKPKHIYVVRNPKDTAVSFYHHYTGFNRHRFDRSWDEFFEMFIEGNILYGSWFDHVLGWWAHRDDPNILFLKYEDMKKNLPGAVQRIAKFLSKDLSSEMTERIAKQTTFAAMSNDEGRLMDEELFKKVSKPGFKFYRKGEVGDWRNYFTDDQNKRFDALYDSKMASSGLEIEFEL